MIAGRSADDADARDRRRPQLQEAAEAAGVPIGTIMKPCPRPDRAPAAAAPEAGGALRKWNNAEAG
jgi:hypothetical protein